jgi:hypothetical protein
MNECDCHEWHDINVIGDWLENFLGGNAFNPIPIRKAATRSIWDRSELSHEELTARIIASGDRIDHEHALLATTLEDGTVSLDNGLHRWTVAVERGIKRVPVEMRYVGPQEDPAAEYIS